jgi:hypothetical protein
MVGMAMGHIEQWCRLVVDDETRKHHAYPQSHMRLVGWPGAVGLGAPPLPGFSAGKLPPHAEIIKRVTL